MSRYAYLVCEEGKEFVWLGKIVTPETTGVTYFHIGDPGDTRISENKLLVRVILRFLAKHIGRAVRVVPEDSFDDLFRESFVKIGGDAEPRLSYEEYVRDFAG